MISDLKPVVIRDERTMPNQGTFDFSKYRREKPKPRTELDFLGLSIEATKQACQTEDGLYNYLANNPATEALVVRGEMPTTGGRLLLVFAHYGFDTTYTEMSAATGCNISSVEQQFNKVRHWLRSAFRLEVQRSGNRVFLANNDELRGQSEKLIANVKKMRSQFDTVLSCVNSIEQSGGTALLPAEAQLYLQAHREAKQLEGGTSHVA